MASHKKPRVDNHDPFSIPDHGGHPEKIVGKKVQDGNMLYKVKWKGQPESAATWQAKNTLSGAAHLIEQFEKTNPTPVEEDQWEVEYIIRKRAFRGQTLYLTKWKGWSHNSNEWLSRDCFADDYMVDAFEIREAMKAFRHKVAKKLQTHEFLEEFYQQPDAARLNSANGHQKSKGDIVDVEVMSEDES